MEPEVARWARETGWAASSVTSRSISGSSFLYASEVSVVVVGCRSRVPDRVNVSASGELEGRRDMTQVSAKLWWQIDRCEDPAKRLGALRMEPGAVSCVSTSTVPCPREPPARGWRIG